MNPVIDEIKKELQTNLESNIMIETDYLQLISVCDSIEECIKQNNFIGIKDLVGYRLFSSKHKKMLNDFLKFIKENPPQKEIYVVDEKIEQHAQDHAYTDPDINTEIKDIFEAKVESFLESLKPSFDLKKILGINENFTNTLAYNISSQTIDAIKPEYNKIINTISNNINLLNKINIEKEPITEKNDSYRFYFITLFVVLLLIALSSLMIYRFDKAISFDNNNEVTTNANIEKKARAFDIIINRLNQLPPADAKFVKDKLDIKN